MVGRVLSWFFSILIMLNIPYIIYFNIAHAISKWKCRKKQYSRIFNPCHESDCKFAQYCEKYEHVFIDEEIDSLKKLIAENRS